MRINNQLAIIGAGPAGFAAALQARRDGTDFLLIGDEPLGGLVAAARKLENLPGYPAPPSGAEYLERLKVQAAVLELSILADRAVALRRIEGGFETKLRSGGTLVSRAVILALGTEPCPYELPGLAEAQAAGRVHRDVRALPPDLAGKRVAVIGGGEAAADMALTVRDRGGEPRLLARGAGLKAAPRLAAEFAATGIAAEYGCRVASVARQGSSLSLELEAASGARRIEAEYLLICIGRQPRLELWRQLNEQHPPSGVETAEPGVFAAGDLIRGADRYVAVAQGDGARAACLAAKYLKDIGI